MKAKTILIGGAVVGILAWLFGRRRRSGSGDPISFDFGSSVPPPPPVPAGATQQTTVVGSFAYWSRLDDEARERYTRANRDRMAAQSPAAKAEAQRRYDEAWSDHQRYSTKANEAWNRERGVR